MGGGAGELKGYQAQSKGDNRTRKKQQNRINFPSHPAFAGVNGRCEESLDDGAATIRETHRSVFARLHLHS